MSDIDLSEAVEAAALASHAAWCDKPGHTYGVAEYDYAERLVTAAAPLIEAQVREQVAREIEGVVGGWECSCGCHRGEGA